MQRLIIVFLAKVIGITSFAQAPTINYQNFAGPMYSTFDLTSSKVILKDTFQLLESGQNLTWDFTQFGEIVDSSQPNYTYSFLPKEESWLLDSARNLWFWNNPEIDFVLRADKNKTIIDNYGKEVPDINDLYFKREDTNVRVVGEGNVYLSSLYSLLGVTNFQGLEFIITRNTGLPYYYNQVFLDSSSIDTLGATPTFWTIRKEKLFKSFDATGSISFPFGQVENTLRLFDLGIEETEKVNKNTGVSQIDSILGFGAYWYAPDLQNCVPIATMYFFAEKPFGGSWNVSSIDAYITDQQSLAVMENWNTPIENWFYPNPAKNEITINGIENPKRYSIYGLNGQILKQGFLQSNVLIIEELPPNFYILEVENEAQKFRSKLIVI